MSSYELEGRIRELRQLQSLIEEAQAEAEAIKDTIKATWATLRSCGPASIRSPGNL